MDDYIRFTLLGTKPDVALEPLRSLQDPETYEVRMTMYYYMNDQYGIHFDYNYTEAPKCPIGYAQPNWCMTEDMVCTQLLIRLTMPFCLLFPTFVAMQANATSRAFNYPHQVAAFYAM